MELAGFPPAHGGGDRLDGGDPDSNGFGRPQKRLRVAEGEAGREAAGGGEFVGSSSVARVSGGDFDGGAGGRKLLCLDLNFKGEGDDEDDGSDVDLMKRSFRGVNGVSDGRRFRFDLNMAANQSDASPEGSPVAASPVEICVRGCVLDGFGAIGSVEQSGLTAAGNLIGGFSEIRVEKINLVEHLVDVKEGNEEVVVEVGNLARVSDACLIMGSENGVDTVTPTRGRNGKRRRGSKSLQQTHQTGLRRSARRALANSLQSTTPPAMVMDKSPSVSSDCEEALVYPNCAESARDDGILFKLELPAPSSNLKTNDLPIFDVFSVYTCLRSFSTLLFLSPFSLETFVMALKCKFANPLMDSIHLSVLRALRLMLESLSCEGNVPASECLRDLNWDLLDAVTWPLYLSEYLLVFSLVSESGSSLSQYYKPLTDEYYKLDEKTKLGILRSICDELMQSYIIRLELERRSRRGRTEIDNGKNEGNDVKSKDPVYETENTGLSEEIADDTEDPNSDECWLCQMDGSLICCDGCPAAYHLKCVGLARDLLPEGNWFCMECTMKRKDGWTKPSHSLRGAELLGIDYHGRLYFGTCGYLLIADSWEQDSSCYYYNKNDVPSVMEVLKSDVSYTSIVNAISTYWGSWTHSSIENHCESNKYFTCEAMNIETTSCDVCKTDGCIEDDVIEAYINPNSHTQDDEVCDCTIESGMITGTCNTSESPAKAPVMAPYNMIPCSKGTFSECADSCAADELPSANLPSGYLSYVMKIVEDDVSWMESELLKYHNHYIFGQTASTIAEEFKLKSFHGIKDGPLKSDEEIISSELKAISKSSTKWCWHSMRRLHVNVWKENCGWCFSCRSSSDRECLFNTLKIFPELCDSSLEGLEAKNGQDPHVASVIFHILSIEDRLRGLLTGSWENLQHRNKWLSDVQRATDVVTLKHLLMVLESNLRLVVLSPEWLKQVDSAATVGSACHVSVSSAHIHSKHGFSRKKSRKNACQDADSNFSFYTKSTIQWWRGGKLSRQVFNWKMLPQQMASLGARQGGCRKIPGIFYPDGSELAKRSKRIAWRAAVEMSVIVAHLAYQVRDLESNIRWNDITNTELFSKASKESKKLVKPLKNVSVRKKRMDGQQAQYLLDFGRRKTVPKMVTEHGIFMEDPSSERKKYWLNESYVPLSLLKAFEMKKLVGNINKKSKVNLSKETCRGKKLQRKDVFSYLFLKLKEDKHAKAGKQVLAKRNTKRKKKLKNKRQSKQHMVEEENESYQCGHCRSDVLVREALKCRFCKHFFHKRHVRASNGNTSKRTYACYNCQRRKHVKPSKAKQNLPQRTGMMTRSAAKQKISKPVKKRKRSVRSEGKRCSKKRKRSITTQKVLPRNSNHVIVEKCTSDITWRKGKRAKISHSYWLNGVRWTRKPNDERGIQFRDKKVILPSGEQLDLKRFKPTCSLCDGDHQSGLIYVSCELCDGWFHGEAFGIALERSDSVIGFRCHDCRMEVSPTCPYLDSAVTVDEPQDEKSIDTEDKTLEMDIRPAGGEAVEGINEVDGVVKSGIDDAVTQNVDRLLILETENQQFQNLSNPLESTDAVHENIKSGVNDADSQNRHQPVVLESQIPEILEEAQ